MRMVRCAHRLPRLPLDWPAALSRRPTPASPESQQGALASASEVAYQGVLV